MDALLCDELLQEIFHRIPLPSSAVVSLVSKRWRRLLRSSTTSLSLHFPPPYDPTTIASFSTFLTHHPFLSSLSIAGPGGEDPLLLAVAASCPNLHHLRFSCSPVSPFSLYTLSTCCIHLSSISVTISRPLSFHWLRCFNYLKRLSLFLTNPSSEINNHQVNEMEDAVFDVEMNLESLSLCGILAGDHGLSFLWRNCKNVKKLQLTSCESIGDYSSFSRFLKCLSGLQELELTTCRSIIDVVLLNLAETCVSLDSLLIYDGGSREGLLQFINQSRCSLRRLDLRLPLDLDNSHLIALSENLNFRGLVSLRLQSCCLVSGEGLKAFGRAVADSLEELALINCDVVQREPGLLTTLGQSLKKLRKLDLSYNDMLLDKELASMLVSCNCLVELKLRGCGRLTNATLGSMIRSRNQLQYIDIKHCCGIEVDGVEFFVLNAPRLRRVEVEQSKLCEVARRWAWNKFIEVVY
ncbi:UNVERIFIED_CONTAM: hypothetical protein Sindi_0696700 [Sesamum indicum]